jgi:hypothetical protein
MPSSNRTRRSGVLEQIAAGLGASWTDLVSIPITAIGVYTTMLLLSRLFGQRQLSRSTTYDLAFVFALGSLVGRVILVRTSLLAAMVGLVTMFTLHLIVGWLHHTVPAFHRVTQNRPVLLVAHGAVVDENLRRARTSRIELYQELRAMASPHWTVWARPSSSGTGTSASSVRMSRPIRRCSARS